MRILRALSARLSGCSAVVTGLLVFLLPGVAWADPMCLSPFQSALCFWLNVLIGVPFVVVCALMPVIWWGLRRGSVAKKTGFLGLGVGLGLAVVLPFVVLQIFESLGLFSVYLDHHPMFLYALLIMLTAIALWLALVDWLG